jgi:CRISPR-associated protein Cmr1
MKLRKPSLALPTLDGDIPPLSTCHCYQVTTLTPIYGGGVKPGEPDLQMPVRAAAIRGQLRFWWRLLKSNHPDKPLKGPDLFAAERALWGGMAEGEEDYSSKVRLRIRKIGSIKTEICQNFLNQKTRTENLALSYVLFPARENANETNHIERELLQAGLQFTLDIEFTKYCTDEQRQEVFQSLRWWASFGGLGARTRRGLGALYVNELQEIINEDGQATTSAILILPVSEKEASDYKCTLCFQVDHSNNRITLKNAIDAWVLAVKPLRNIRQEPGIGRVDSRPRPGRSFWPEPDSIRQITRCPDMTKHPTAPHPPTHPARISFLRAAFGLPIVFEFKGERTDPYKTELVSQYEGGRMASPLILKTMVLADGKYAPVALLLPRYNLKKLAVQLKKIGGHAGLPLHTISSGTGWNPANASHVKPIIDNGADNALDAFLNYFKTFKG